MKYCSLVIIALVLSTKIYAISPAKRDVVEELVQKLEALDPNIKTHKDEWMKVRQHLEQSAQQSESIAGLKLSVQHILDQWGGLRFRVLDETDAQYYAVTGESLTLPRAWFESRGSRWVVQYSENDKLRRGDSVLHKDFSPFAKAMQESASWTLPLSKPVTVSVQSKPMSEWALDLTQAASKTLIVNNEKVCVEKVWFWLNESVSQALNSKLEKGLCAAMVLDLRDVFGEGMELPKSLKKKGPVAVLTNKGTREGAVRLARHLKTELSARVFGELSESSSALQKKEKLQKLNWNLLVIGDGGNLRPDVEIKDRFLNAEGVDDVKEAGLSWVKKTLLD